MNKQFYFAYALASLALLFLWSDAFANEISDFNFNHSRRAGDACVSPKGRNLTCNVWHFQEDRGFHRRCGKDVFRKLEQSSGGVVAPKRSCVALYDSMWADMRDFSHITEEELGNYDPNNPLDPIVMELTRPLLHAKFWQYLKVRHTGNYLFKACMTARFFEEPEYVVVESGMQATLSRWQSEVPGETLHAVLPEKDRVLLGQVAPFFVVPGELRAVNESNDGLYERDGYTGHAGLLDAYFETSDSAEARYVCHTQDVFLEDGFYVARGRVNPALREDDGDGVVSFYDGWGAIAHISLRKKD
jgi:hypothetical protein